MRGAPQGRPLPTAIRADGIPGAPHADFKVLEVRIVTEKDGGGQRWPEIFSGLRNLMCVFWVLDGVRVLRHNLLDFSLL